MARRILIETSILALLCASSLPGDAQESASKKKIAIGTGGASAAPRVVPATTVPLRAVPVGAKRSYPHTHLEKGLFFKQQGRSDEALLEFILAVQENPAQVRAFYEQAEIFKQRGKTELAKSALEQALAVNPGYNEARSSLVQLHVQSGNFLGAASEVGRILGLGGPAKPAQPTVAGAKSAPAAKPASIATYAGGAAKRSSAKQTELSKIVGTPIAQIHKEQLDNDVQDPARAIASWLAPEQSRASRSDTEPSQPSGSVSAEALPGATPSFDAVAASLGLLPQQKERESSPSAPASNSSSVTSSSSLPASSSSPSAVSGSNANGLTAAQIVAGIAEPPAPAAVPQNPVPPLPIVNRAPQKPNIFGRTMTALMHPPMPHWPASDKQPSAPAAAPAAVPGENKAPVASWMKTLSSPLKRGKQPKTTAPAPSMPSIVPGTASAVTITRIPTPAESNADKRNEPSSPDSLNPQLQKMLAAIMPPAASPSESSTKNSAEPSVPSVQSPTAQNPEAAEKSASVSAPAESKGSEKDSKNAAVNAALETVPTKPNYALLNSNASNRMPELTRQAVVAKNQAAQSLKQDSWMTGMVKRASAMMPKMPKMPELPKLPEMPRLSMPTWLGGQDHQTPQAVASRVRPVLPPEPVTRPHPAVPAEAIPSDVRNILSSVDGGGAETAQNSNSGLTVEHSNQANNSVETLPSAVKDILTAVDGKPFETPAPAAAAESASVVAAGAAGAPPVNSQAAGSGDQPVVSVIPRAVADVLAAQPAQNGDIANAAQSPAVLAALATVSPAAVGNAPAAPKPVVPKSPAPTPVDVQGILSKLSTVIPQQAASFFHFKKPPSNPAAATPASINLAQQPAVMAPSAAKNSAVLPPASPKSARARVTSPQTPIAMALPRGEEPAPLPSVVKDVLNKVDTSFVPTVASSTLRNQYVPAPVPFERSTGEGPQPIESRLAAAVAASVPAPTPATGADNMFANVPVPEVRPKAPVPVPVNVQSILSKISTADPAAAKLNLKHAAAALLPQPGAVKVYDGQTVAGVAAPSARVDMQLPAAQQHAYNHGGQSVSPGQVPSVQAAASLPVVVRDVLQTAEKFLPPAISGPAAATRAFVVEPLAIPHEDIQAPNPVATFVTPFQPAEAPAPVGADLSKHFSNVVPEVRPQAQPEPVVVPQVAEQTAAPAASSATKPAPYTGPKLIASRSARSGAFTYMQPVLDTDRLLMGAAGQLRTIPAAAAKTEKPKAPAPPPEDAVTKRMRYLLAHGTQNLKPGEAFMYSEETGEGLLFMPGGGSERRKLNDPQDHEQVMQARRPDIVEPKDLQYSLSLLGKLLPQGSRPSNEQDPRAISGPTLEQLMNQGSKSFFGWVKDTFKWGEPK